MLNFVHHKANFFEVVNQFPILKDKLSELAFSPSEIREGETVEEFFVRKAMTEDEVDFLVTRLNRDLKAFMRQTAHFVARPVQDVVVEQQIALAEEEEE